jgi:FAD/FMN-containing dehydrogenase/Fe-S oxidoreductase
MAQIHLMKTAPNLEYLSSQLKGELLYDDISRSIYSTDASVYSEKPLAVAYPADADDITKLVRFCRQYSVGLTVRGAGTSLAGQVVGTGIIADISRHMTGILELNVKEKWVRVQPGVVLDELNMFLKPHGLFFGPETSTASRCNIGGMVGNNACGLHSIVYGSTREHLLEVKCILSDGTEALFSATDRKSVEEKSSLTSLEGTIYRNITEILSNDANRRAIKDGFPHPDIPRRNTGYCLDILATSSLFDPGSEQPFNLAKLIAGSEGTLAIATEIKLNLVPLPPKFRALLCVHLIERSDAFRANLTALRHKPAAIEMMDDRIITLTKDNLSQRNNRFFISGEPGAILITEFACNTKEEALAKCMALTSELKDEGYGYAFPVVTGSDISKVWELRKAGLGVLSNMKGDSRPVSLIEDTAVLPSDLPAFMEELTALLARHGLEAVLHAHIGTGELHVRPLLNLKCEADVALFRTIGYETAILVKKYRGSISGEHGDGRLRGEFIPIVLGEQNFSLIKRVKEAWDPDNILNPGIIISSLPMNSSLRYDHTKPATEPATIYDFSNTEGIIRAAEKCNGSADCRKSAQIGGTMCPSYMATGDERHSTRARANILREYLSKDTKGNGWNHREIYEILDLCLSCKGCKAECPSGVDIAKMKGEFLQHWYDIHGIPLRTRLIANITSINRLGSLLPSLFNFVVKNRYLGGAVKRLTGFATERSIPLLYRYTLNRWLRKNLKRINPETPLSQVCLFVDEFTNYNDTETGIAAVNLLTSLNYRIIIVRHRVSARTFISKGLIRRAAVITAHNIKILAPIAARGIPVVGIEPSAILGFRDEYPDLAGEDLRATALGLVPMAMTIDEFIAAEFKAGRISRDRFTSEAAEVLVHIHCQQKAAGCGKATLEALSIPKAYTVREVPSGCCGMAGSFGYEKEHFELSNKIGELVLFPEVRSAATEVLISAPGTSCRHHIADGTGRHALHPVQILYRALIR